MPEIPEIPDDAKIVYHYEKRPVLFTERFENMPVLERGKKRPVLRTMVYHWS